MLPLSAERTYLVIDCLSCGESIQKPVAWLITKDNMTCKGCGAFIDLNSAANRQLIEETAKHCERLDAKVRQPHRAA